MEQESAFRPHGEVIAGIQRDLSCFPNHNPRSGRAMARTGHRMMPTFPSPPLKFRTVSFPQHGFKASRSDSACPARPEVKPAPGMPARRRWFAMVLRACAGYRDGGYVGSKTTFAFGDPGGSAASRWPLRADGHGFFHPTPSALAETPWQPSPVWLSFGDRHVSLRDPLCDTGREHWSRLSNSSAESPWRRWAILVPRSRGSSA